MSDYACVRCTKIQPIAGPWCCSHCERRSIKNKMCVKCDHKYACMRCGVPVVEIHSTCEKCDREMEEQNNKSDLLEMLLQEKREERKLIQRASELREKGHVCVVLTNTYPQLIGWCQQDVCARTTK